MMISDDHKYTIGLMQQQQQQPQPSSSSSSSVNHLQSSSFTIYDNNHHPQLTPKKSISSSRIRVGLRCLCPLDDKYKQQFDQIFSFYESPTNISECLFNQYIARLTTNYINTLIILSGQYCEISQLQVTLTSLTLNYLHEFINEHNLHLRISIQEFSNETTKSTNYGKSTLLLTSDYSVNCPIETFQHINQTCSIHKSCPLLITFHIIDRLSDIDCVQIHILSTNNNDNKTTNNNQDEFSNLLMSLSLSLPSSRQKQSYHLSNKRNNHEQSLTSILNEYVINNDEHFLYILATVSNDRQIKYWTKLPQLFKAKRNQLKMCSHDSSLISNEEIWVDGPLSSPSQSNKEIWIDGPRDIYHRSPRTPRLKSTPKHRPTSKHSSVLSPRHTFSAYAHNDMNESQSSNTFETESIISSHCHLPVLPVFKDHSLLPFRSHQTPANLKPVLSESSNINLQLSTDKINDDLEMLEKTLETLLVPSPIVPTKTDNSSIMNQSLNRMNQLSSSMSNDEKSKRLSRIVSPTRFDKILSSENHPPSVPNSPFVTTKHRHSRASNHSSQTLKKPQIPTRTSSLAETTNTRPTLFQRLFGLRSSVPNAQQPIVIQSPPSSPLISPLTVTLDSHDDLMPLTTSSTASSASGRASSSGYESMSNVILEEMITSIPSTIISGNNSIKTRNKPMRNRRMNNNVPWTSPLIPDKSNHHCSQQQQRLSELKHRQNELKLELAMTKAFLLMDKNKILDHNDSRNSTMNNSPLHTIKSNVYDEEKELEKDIEYLEKRLASVKSQLICNNYQKSKQFKS